MFILLIIVALLNLENSSMKCRYHNLFPSWRRSIAIVLLKFVALANSTIGHITGFLNSLHVLQYVSTFYLLYEFYLKLIFQLVLMNFVDFWLVRV